MVWNMSEERTVVSVIRQPALGGYEGSSAPHTQIYEMHAVGQHPIDREKQSTESMGKII